jgi:DNA (cytosine-5)-methyltransferase 1
MADGLPDWAHEPDDVPRVAAGVKDRAARLKALGNAVVPQIPELIGRAIMQAEGMT